MTGVGSAPRFDLRGLIKNSLVEWEGRIAAVAVAGGCDWRCPFCHSWRYVTGLADMETRSIDELFDLLDREEGWIDGVVVTGGEPTLQPGLEDLLRALKARGVPAKLHTNGGRPDVIEALLAGELLACLALDAKAPLDGRLSRATGVSLDDGALGRVAGSFALLAAAGPGVEREYHTTLCPAFVREGDLAEIAMRLAPGGLWVLQNYEPDDVLDRAAAGAERYWRGDFERLAGTARAAYAGGRVLARKGRGV